MEQANASIEFSQGFLDVKTERELYNNLGIIFKGIKLSIGFSC